MDEIETRAYIEKFDLIIRLFKEAHAKHTRPFPAHPRPNALARRANATCRHLRDQIMASELADLPSIPAHIWSNSLCAERLCLTCSRMAHRVERRGCGLCGLPNGYDAERGGWRERDRKCAVNLVYMHPLTLHLPLCRTCEQIIARYRTQMGGITGSSIPPEPQAM